MTEGLHFHFIICNFFLNLDGLKRLCKKVIKECEENLEELKDRNIWGKDV